MLFPLFQISFNLQMIKNGNKIQNFYSYINLDGDSYHGLFSIASRQINKKLKMVPRKKQSSFEADG